MPEKKFDAKQETFGSTIFSNNGIIFEIPMYQRAYSWGVDEVDDFWTDLFHPEIKSGSVVFLGSMVFTGNQKNKFIVIDGQQRLITVTLLISAIRDIYKKFGNEVGIERMQANFICINEHGEASEKFRLNFEDISRVSLSDIQHKNFKYSKVTVKKDKEKKNIYENYKLFYDNLLKEIEIKKFSTNGIDTYLKEIIANIVNTNIVVINTKDVFSAYEVFETINSRGLDLTNTDLIKNWIFKDISDEKDLIKKWINSEKNINTNIGFEFNKFIRYYYISKYGYVSNKDLFRKIKDKIGENKELKINFLKNIVKYNKYLEFIVNPSFDNKVLDGIDEHNAKKISFFVSGLNEMNITQVYPLIFSLLNKKKDLPKFSNILDFLVDFHLLYSKFTKSPARQVEKLYSKISYDISNKTEKEDYDLIYNNLLKGLKENIQNYVTKDNFVRNFKNLKYGTKNNKSLIKYIYMKYYEEEISLKYNYLDTTIEHIYSQKDKSFNIRKNVNYIGNLTLLYSTGNGIIGNIDVSEKWKKYKEHDKNGNIKKLIKDVENGNYNENWLKEDIDKRTNDISDEIYSSCSKKFR